MGGSLASTAPATVTTGTETPGGRPALRALVHEQRLNEAAGITGLRREENGTWNVVLPDGSRIQAGTIAAARHMRETLIRARGGHPLAPPLAPGAEMDTHPAHVPSTGVRPLTTRAPRNIALTDFGDARDFKRGGHRALLATREGIEDAYGAENMEQPGALGIEVQAAHNGQLRLVTGEHFLDWLWHDSGGNAPLANARLEMYLHEEVTHAATPEPPPPCTGRGNGYPPCHVPSTGVRPLTTRAPRNIALTDFGDAGDFLRGGDRRLAESRERSKDAFGAENMDRSGAHGIEVQAAHHGQPLYQPFPATNMLNEYDMVDLVTGPPDFPAGTDGVILFVYDAHPPAYEVEFTAPDGTNLGTHTVRGEQLQLRKSGDNNGSR